ncbi:MAG: DUF3060 domain-containing protein [Pyrinomonadaceae bacterium]
MEKYTSNATPWPSISPTPTATPVDPADILTVDASVEGDLININGYEIKKTETCKTFNRVMINGDKNVITLKGGCSQIMINGDANEITLDAATEIVLNGSENKVTYTRLINGNQPTITENRPGNTIEKISAPKPGRQFREF